MSLFSTAVLRNSYANRPTDNSIVTAGRLFYATDRGVLFRDNGTGWDACLDINGLSEDTTPDADNDYVLTYDASDGYLKKVTLTNLGIGGGGMENPMNTAGDLIIGGASGDPARLAATTSGYVLTANGAGVAPSWKAATGGSGATVIGDVTLSTTAANVTFSGISGSYHVLYLYINATTDKNDTWAAIAMNFNGDTTDANYYVLQQYYGAYAGNSYGANRNIGWAGGATSPANQFGAVWMEIFDYANTVASKQYTCRGAQFRTGSDHYGFHQVGWWNNAAAITSIAIVPDGCNFAAGTRISLIAG